MLFRYRRCGRLGGSHLRCGLLRSNKCLWESLGSKSCGDSLRRPQGKMDERANTMWRKLLSTDAPASVLLIRLMVGLVFLSEGLQKFVFPEVRGVGRFVKIGLPEPEFLAYFVAVFEVVCGALIVLGLLTRLAVVPTITIMLVAIILTKLPIFPQDGFWQMAHDARTDFSMLLGSLFLLIVGGGRWSVDRTVVDRHKL